MPKTEYLKENPNEQIIAAVAQTVYRYASSVGRIERIGSIEKIKAFLRIDPELIREYEENQLIFDGGIPTLLELDTPDADSKLRRPAMIIEDTFREIKGEDYLEESTNDFLFETRTYFLLLLTRYGDRKAIEKYTRALRRNFIKYMAMAIVRYEGEIAREFLISLDRPDRLFYEKELAEITAANAPESQDRVQSMIDTFIQRVKTDLVENHPDLDPIFVDRIMRNDGASANELAATRLQKDREVWLAIHEFLKNPENINVLAKKMIGSWNS